LLCGAREPKDYLADNGSKESHLHCLRRAHSIREKKHQHGEDRWHVSKKMLFKNKKVIGKEGKQLSALSL